MERTDGGKRPVAGRQKVLVVASAGGHWVQLMQLEEAWRGVDVVHATTGNDNAPGIVDLRRLPDGNLDNKLRLIPLAWSAFRLVWSVRPSVVVSTGAAPGFFVIVFAKIMLRARTIWIDSVANAEHMSKSGLWVRRFADEWLVQWPGVALASGAQYRGSVL